MKRLFSVLVLAFTLSMNATEVKAQSVVGMGPGSIYRTDYRGSMTTFSMMARSFGSGAGTTLKFIWTCLSMKGALLKRYDPDAPYVDENGRLHLGPVARLINEATGQDVTNAFTAHETSLELTLNP